MRENQDMKKTGYIEGYFGRQLSWEERHGILEHLAHLKMNTYLYAPKEDPYHRVEWKKPYPDEWKKELSDFSRAGRDLGVQVIPSLGPGLSYDYLSEEDYRILLEKFRLYFTMGISTMALLMDDILPELPENCRGEFSSLGQAHARLLVRLQKDLRSENSATELIFCPTIYTDDFVEGAAADSDYIKDLAAEIPGDIPIYWTGNKVVPAKINEVNAGRIRELFSNNVIIWDNYYANDYTPFRIFLGPLLGREKAFTDSLAGFMINPTGLYNTDKFLLSLTAKFLDDGASDLAAWKDVSRKFELHPYIEKVIEYFWSPFVNPDESFLDTERLKGLEDFYDQVVVKWQNPLRLEWFPYLNSLLIDVQNATRDYAKEAEWIDMRYPPMIAALVKAKQT
ncbi:MAG: beta-N-acetylglucosaminidase domain-containing protein [Spirochaetales bacterium]|nr:beta-N-acetylglucosaminidase domain-containing protein [Spirochaetales bacterium]